MHIKLLPGTFAAVIGIGGTGFAMIFPDHQRTIGAALIAISVGILIFSIRFDDGRLLVGRPNPLKSWWALLHTHVPFHEAARLAYEVMERTGIDDMTLPGYSSSEVPLTHFKYVLISAARRGEIKLYGRRAPSRQSLPIPIDVMSQLQPEDGTNSLLSLSRATPLDYHDVWLTRSDLKRAVRDRIALLDRVNKGLSGDFNIP
jgi:hypothetical protein